MKTKALFIVPTLKRAGAETQLVDLVNALDSNRFDKTLVIFGDNADQLTRVDRATIDFHQYSRSSKYDFSLVKNVARLIDDKSIDVIHCTLQISLLIGWLARRFSVRRPRLIVALHTTRNVALKEELFDRLLYRWIIARCSCVIFVCKAQADYWKKKYPFLKSTAKVVYNGVDLEYFSRKRVVATDKDVRQRYSISPEAKVVTCIAAFRREKGHKYLLEAFARLEGDAVLLLVGDGESRRHIEQKARDLGVLERTRFLGVISDVRDVLFITDVSVLASTAVETFSIAMLESMAMEVPMVATDIGGMAEAIKPGHAGDLVPPADVPKLAQSLQSCIENTRLLLEMGKNSRVIVGTRFSVEIMSQHTERLLVKESL